jgi:hypothetical protein
MYTWETLMDRFGEDAEREYLRAKASGMVDPMLYLKAVDPADSWKVEVRVCERSELLEHLRRACPESVDVASPRSKFDYFSIAIVLPDGLHLIDRLIPTG